MFDKLTQSALRFLRESSARLLQAERKYKQAAVLLVDIALCFVAVITAFSLRLGYWDIYSKPILLVFGVEVALFVPIFILSRIYSNLFRFHGTRGMGQVALACLGLSIPNIVIFGVYGSPGVPRTLSVIFPLVFLVLIALSRVLARYLLVDIFGEKASQRRVVIFGAGSAGRQLASSIAHEQNYRLIAYIDDDPVLIRSRLEGVPIYPSSELETLLEEQEAEIVFLAMPSLSRSKRAKIIEHVQRHGVNVLTLPGINEIVDGRVSLNDLREVDVTELLSRDPVAPDPELLHMAVTGKSVLVTGAGGSIGSELARQIVKLGPLKLVLLDMSEAALYQIDQEVRESGANPEGIEVEIVTELASVDNKQSVQRIFAKHEPDTVYHAAAYKHVPMVEANVVAGVGNNVLGTLNCALAARDTGVERFILVSTDKAVRPTNVMGASKRVCELILQALAQEDDCSTIYSMVRFGNVLGSSGSVVPRFRKQIELGGPITLTHRDITRYFMTIPEAAELVIQAGAMAVGGEVYLLDMGEPIRISELAETMVRLSGRTVRSDSNPQGDIEIVETGLRPGEKLYEELLIDAEARPTSHIRIFQANEACKTWSSLMTDLREIQVMRTQGNVVGLRGKLAKLVVGFGS
ncbi:MAG: polysaccharide biosynthesis protein [Sphingomonadaceae bacterium]|nr:polysaccharide biosynthesis protein [Sphingomonadaceae bacterium]